MEPGYSINAHLFPPLHNNVQPHVLQLVPNQYTTRKRLFRVSNLYGNSNSLPLLLILLPRDITIRPRCYATGRRALCTWMTIVSLVAISNQAT